MIKNIEEKYKKEVLPKLMSELKIDNPLGISKVRQVVVNVGVKEAAQNKAFSL